MPYILYVVKLYNASRTFIKISRNIYLCSRVLHKAQEGVSKRGCFSLASFDILGDPGAVSWGERK